MKSYLNMLFPEFEGFKRYYRNKNQYSDIEGEKAFTGFD